MKRFWKDFIKDTLRLIRGFEQVSLELALSYPLYSAYPRTSTFNTPPILGDLVQSSLTLYKGMFGPGTIGDINLKLPRWAKGVDRVV